VLRLVLTINSYDFPTQLSLIYLSKTGLYKIFGSKKEGIREGWRQLHNDEIRNLSSSSNIMRATKSRMIEWLGHEAGMEANKYTYSCRALVGEHEEGRRQERSRRRWQHYTKIELEAE
jgi:hypothetical protein